MEMRILLFLLFSLAFLVDVHANVLDDLKTGYCYVFFSRELQNPNLSEEKVAHNFPTTYLSAYTKRELIKKIS